MVEAEVGRRLEGKIERKKKQKRTALLDSAYELFTTVGFFNTTIRDITRKAGVAKGTFYLYYPDKEAILNELVRTKAARILTDACSHMEDSFSPKMGSMSVADKFIFIIDYMIDRAAEDASLLKLIEKNLTWGMFTSTEKEGHSLLSSDEDSMDFESYIMSMLETDGVKLRESKLLIFTLLELVSSTCFDVLMYNEPVSLDEYKPYLNGCIRNLVEAAIIK